MKQCYRCNADKLEGDEHLKYVLKSNDRGDSKEYVMHGSNIQGIVNMIKKNQINLKKILCTLEKKRLIILQLKYLG